MNPHRIYRDDPRYSPHHVNGNRDAPSVCELRVRCHDDSPLEVVGTAESFCGGDLDRLIRGGAAYAEYESISGFYVHATARRED